MKRWLFQERDTGVLALLAFCIAIFLLLISHNGLISPPAPSAAGSWHNLGDLSRCVGEPVTLTGTVLNVTRRETVTKLQLLPFVDRVAVVAFPRKTLNISEGDIVRVDGRVQEWRSKEEIIADALHMR